MCTPSVRPSAQTPRQRLIVKSKCRAEFQATPELDYIPQHFDSFVVPSRRPIDGRGQKLDIELECPGRQINDSLRPKQSEAGSHDRAACLQSIWTRLSSGQNDLLYSSLTLSIITHSRFLAMLKVHKYSASRLKVPSRGQRGVTVARYLSVQDLIRKAVTISIIALAKPLAGLIF